MKRHLVPRTMLAAVLAVAVPGCSNKYDSPAKVAGYRTGSTPANAPMGGMAGGPPAAAKGPIMDGPTGIRPVSNTESQGQGNAPAQLASVAQSQPDRYLIKNASISVETKDARAASTRLIEAVRLLKGYVSGLAESTDALGVLSVTLDVRVPARRFEQQMQDLAGLGKVLDKQVTAEDVTEEYVDTTARVRNLKRTEARLLEHLGRTGKLSETLLVEKELTRVREEVEGLEGRLRFLSNRVDFSTISVTLREEARPLPVEPAQSFSTGKEATDATRSLLVFLRGLWSTVIWLAIWAVVWVPPLIAAVFGVKRLRRAARPQGPVPPPPARERVEDEPPFAGLR